MSECRIISFVFLLLLLPENLRSIIELSQPSRACGPCHFFSTSEAALWYSRSLTCGLEISRKYFSRDLPSSTHW